MNREPREEERKRLRRKFVAESASACSLGEMIDLVNYSTMEIDDLRASLAAVTQERDEARGAVKCLADTLEMTIKERNTLKSEKEQMAGEYLAKCNDMVDRAYTGLRAENADLLEALQLVKEQRQEWWGKAVARNREISNLRAEKLLILAQVTESDTLIRDALQLPPETEWRVEFYAQEIRRLVESSQGACDECSGDGWVYSRVEGRGACTCMVEAEPFQILQDALEQLACLGNGEHYGNSDGNLIAIKALKTVLPLDYDNAPSSPHPAEGRTYEQGAVDMRERAAQAIDAWYYADTAGQDALDLPWEVIRALPTQPKEAGDE